MFVISNVGRNIRWLVLLFSALVGLFTLLSTAKNDEETTKCKWGWSIPLKLTTNSNGDICFFVKEVLEVLYLENEVVKRGFSRIENFLKEQGQKDPFVYQGVKRYKITYKAFVALLMQFCGTKTKLEHHAEQNIKSLRMCVIDRIVHVEDLIGNGSLQNTKPQSSKGDEPAGIDYSGSTSVNKENQPVNKTMDYTPVTDKHHPTSALLQEEKLKQSQQKQKCEKGRKFKSRPLAKRVKLQTDHNMRAAKEIHHGSKEDFILGFAHSVSGDCNSASTECSEWDGKLSIQDMIEMAKNVHSTKDSRTMYDIMTSDKAMERFHINKHDILHFQDNMNSTELVCDMRKRVPGLLDSGYSVNKLKKEQNVEFHAVLQPERTATGWKVNPNRLHQCLTYIYPWLPAEEYWRIYGDARTYGKQKSVLLAIGNLNNEQLLHGVKVQSPKEFWPVSVFYFADSRLNLELNLAGKDSVSSNTAGWLNQWIIDMQSQNHSIYLTGDSMFLDAVADGALDPRSDGNFNIYNYETIATKGEVSNGTGLRSGLNRSVTRTLPDSLLPALSTKDYLLCIDHMFTRMTETLLTLRVKSIFSLEAESLISKKDRDCALGHLESNINLRGTRSGHFKFHFESGKNKLAPVSLNKSCAQLVSAPPSYFEDATYPHILDNVAPKISCPGLLSESVQKAINWPTRKISEYDCEKLIWESHFKMHEICRLDPNPKLKDGKQGHSLSADDYHFGVSEEQVVDYIKHADIFHGLMCFRYGKDRLTPYMVKAIDIVRILLRSLPFHSLMRVSTEGGEHLHYEHQQHFFHHTARGGGKTFNDPVLAIFEHMYRRIRSHIRKAPASVQEQFELFVNNCKLPLPVPSNPVSSSIQDQQVTGCSTREGKMCLAGHKFIIAGSLHSHKITHEVLAGLIKDNGGQVLNVESIPVGLPVDVICVTTQKECDKSSNINLAVATAVQRKWKLVSPEFIKIAAKNNNVPPLDKFELNLNKIKNAPASSSLNIVTRNVDETHFKRTGAFTDLKKTLKANANNTNRAPKNQGVKKSHKKKRLEPLDKPPNGYMMFVKENAEKVKLEFQLNNKSSSLRDVNAKLSKMWQQMSVEQKMSYKQKGKELFENQNQ